MAVFKRNLILLFSLFIVYSCASVKKKDEKEEIQKERKEEVKETSNKKEEITEPTKNEIVISIQDLVSKKSDFKQSSESGKGNKTTIEKKGDKLHLTTENSGSSSVQENNSRTETIYDSEFVLKESKKIIKRIPFWIWIIIALYFLIKNRNTIFKILSLFFPYFKVFLKK